MKRSRLRQLVGELVLVQWWDAEAHASWTAVDDARALDAPVVESVGWLELAGGDAVALAADSGAGGLHDGDVNRLMVIPRKMIRKVLRVQLVGADT